jgi:hypothetical protein
MLAVGEQSGQRADAASEGSSVPHEEHLRASDIIRPLGVGPEAIEPIWPAKASLDSMENQLPPVFPFR